MRRRISYQITAKQEPRRVLHISLLLVAAAVGGCSSEATTFCEKSFPDPDGFWVDPDAVRTSVLVMRDSLQARLDANQWIINRNQGTVDLRGRLMDQNMRIEEFLDLIGPVSSGDIESQKEKGHMADLAAQETFDARIRSNRAMILSVCARLYPE